MALLDSSTFSFDGTDLRSFGMRFGWIDAPETDTMTGLNRIIMETEMNAVRTRPSQYAVTYEGCLEFSFVIFRNDGKDITYEDSYTLNRWLSGSKVHKKLTFPGEQSVYYMAICTEITDQIIGGFLGKRVTFRCDAPYGYLYPITKKIVSTGNKAVKFYNYSDEGNYYPELTIKGSDNTIRITNHTDNERMMVLNLSSITDKTIQMDCERMRITDTEGKLIPVYKIGWDDTENIYWFRLLSGANQIEIDGSCEFIITAAFPRKVGAV